MGSGESLQHRTRGRSQCSCNGPSGDLRQWTLNTTSTPVAPSITGLFSLANLGAIHLPAALAGNVQQWQAQILAASTNPGDAVDIDCIFLVPLNDGAATAAGVGQGSLPVVSTFTARDEFHQGSATFSGATLPVGGTWAQTGATGVYSIDTSNHRLTRSANDGASAATGGAFGTASGSTLSNVVGFIVRGWQQRQALPSSAACYCDT